MYKRDGGKNHNRQVAPFPFWGAGSIDRKNKVKDGKKGGFVCGSFGYREHRGSWVPKVCLIRFIDFSISFCLSRAVGPQLRRERELPESEPRALVRPARPGRERTTSTLMNPRANHILGIMQG